MSRLVGDQKKFFPCYNKKTCEFVDIRTLGNPKIIEEMLENVRKQKELNAKYSKTLNEGERWSLRRDWNTLDYRNTQLRQRIQEELDKKV